MWFRSIVGCALAACASSQEPAVGVSTAPQSVPAPAPPDVEPAPATPEPSVDAAAPPPAIALGRLHPVTGMATGAKKLDVRGVLARIEKQPGVFDACSVLASAEPDAPEGSWNVRVTLAGGAAALHVESPVAPAFERCLETAGKQLSLQGLPDGEIMVLLGLAR